jgi:hypothetical protein
LRSSAPMSSSNRAESGIKKWLKKIS